MKEIVSFTVERDVPHNNYSFPTGWGNGYVGVPRGHALFEHDYNSEELYRVFDEDGVYPHGGFTFADHYNPSTGKVEDDYWYFGFDTAHLGDNNITWDKAAVIRHTEELRTVFDNLEHKLDVLGL